MRQSYKSEPVPTSTQLAVMPFLAAVDGFLRETGELSKLRITIHRTINREGQIFLQQACGYIDNTGLDWKKTIGRTFEVSTGVIGAAFATKKIWRTKRLENIDTLRSLLASDIAKVKDGRDPSAEPPSFLAIPFLGPADEPILILYADCDVLNFFADDHRVKAVASMAKGFCKLFDWLQDQPPFLNLKNFPFDKGTPVEGEPSVYRSIQEGLDSIEAPRFKRVVSFNYEATSA